MVQYIIIPNTHQAEETNSRSLHSGEFSNLSSLRSDKLRGDFDPVSVTPLNYGKDTGGDVKHSGLSSQDTNETTDDVAKMKKKIMKINKRKSYEDLLYEKTSKSTPLTNVLDTTKESFQQNNSDCGCTSENTTTANGCHKQKVFNFPTPIRDPPSKLYSTTEDHFQKYIFNYFSEIFGFEEQTSDEKLRASPERSEGEDHFSVACEGKMNVLTEENFETNEEIRDKTWFEKYMWEHNPIFYQMYIKYLENPNRCSLSIDSNKLSNWGDILGQVKNVWRAIGCYYYFLVFILTEIIMMIPNLLTSYIKDLCYVITQYCTLEDTITDDKIREDSNVLIKIVMCIVTFPLVIYVSYNWYFLISLYQKTSDGIELRLARDSNRYKIKFYQGYGTIFTSIIDGLFGTALTPLTIIDTYLYGDGHFCFPAIMKMIKYTNEIPLNNIKRTIYMILSLIIVYNLNFFERMNGFLKGEKSTLVYFSIAVVVVYQLSYLFEYVVYSVYTEKADTMIIFQKAFQYGLKMINPFLFIFAIILYIGYLIGQSIIITYPSAIISLIYIWIHCLFGITLYGDNAMPFTKKWFSYITLMDQDFDKDVELFYKDDSCIEPGLWKIFCRNVVKIIRCNLSMLILISMILFFFIESIYKLNSDSFRRTIFIFLGVILSLLVAKFGIDLKRDFNKTEFITDEPICVKGNYSLWRYLTSWKSKSDEERVTA
jgi:hypothetical protein